MVKDRQKTPAPLSGWAGWAGWAGCGQESGFTQRLHSGWGA